jgi:hypothetical protein
MDEIDDRGRASDHPAAKQATADDSIVNAMNRYFMNDSGRSRGDVEYEILSSVKRYFEGKPARRT